MRSILPVTIKPAQFLLSRPMTELGIMGGTRDFLPQEMNRREYVIDRMKQVFRKYGFEPLETPSIERWETLAGKYGEEGEKLIYHVISSGKLRQETDDPNFLTNYLSEAESRLALRYDLTVPLSRVMGMYGDQTDPDPTDPKGKRQLRKLSRPFKRYQIQPVWRGDRPGAGRYREFFQCDVDVIGAESLLVEAELVAIGSEILSSLGFPSFTIRMNHRKLLTGLIQWSGIPKNQEAMALTSVDKLDKAMPEEVQQELLAKNCPKEAVEKLFKVIGLEGNSREVLEQAQELLAQSPLALEGIRKSTGPSERL
jgi:histidyl-tRNA synthetase